MPDRTTDEGSPDDWFWTGGDLEMTHKRATRVDEATVRRRGARLLRLLGFIGFGGTWLELLLNYIIALFLPEKSKPITLVVLTFLAAMVAYRMVRELADQLERGEWP
jgi:hypothetical protein